VREFAFSVLKERGKQLIPIINANYSTIVEILSHWAVTQRDSRFPLQTLAGIMKCNINFAGVCDEIFDLASQFLSNGNEAEIIDSLVIVGRLARGHSYMIMQDPQSISDMVIEHFRSRNYAIREAVVDCLMALSIYVDKSIALPYIFHATFRIESVVEVRLIASIASLNLNSNAILQLFMPCIPTIVGIAVTLQDEGFQPAEYLMAFLAIPQLIYAYGEEVAVLWLLYLSIWDALLDSRLPIPSKEPILNLFLLSTFVKQTEERMNQLEKRMENLIQILVCTNNSDQQANIILFFVIFLQIASEFKPCFWNVLRWCIERINALGKNEPTSINFNSDLIESVWSLMKGLISQIDWTLISEYLNLATESISCELNLRVREFGLRFLCRSEKSLIHAPRETVQKIIGILINDRDANAKRVAKFLLHLSVNRKDELIALGKAVLEGSIQRLAGLEGHSAFADLLVALIVQFPLSAEVLSLILAHFPVVSARLAFAWVYPWVLAQLREMSEVLPVLLESVVKLFCQRIERLVMGGNLQMDLVLELAAVLESVKSDPEGKALLQRVIGTCDAASFHREITCALSLLSGTALQLNGESVLSGEYNGNNRRC
jgi:hypothetical protein